AERAYRGVEALNPKGAEGALAPLAVTIGILIRLLDRLLGNPDRILAPAVIALGGFEYFLVLGVGGDAAFHASHEMISSSRKKTRLLYAHPLSGAGGRPSAVRQEVFLDVIAVGLEQH